MSQLKDSLMADDMDTFRSLLSAPQTDASELSCIMKEALARDHAAAAYEMLSHGWAVHPYDARAAVAASAKKCLTLFLDSGCDINELESNLDVPALW